MNSQPVPLERLDPELLELLLRYCDGNLTPEQAEVMNRRLLESPDLQLPALLLLRSHADLLWQHRGTLGLDSADSTNAVVFGEIIERANKIKEGNDQGDLPPRILCAPPPLSESKPVRRSRWVLNFNQQLVAMHRRMQHYVAVTQVAAVLAIAVLLTAVAMWPRQDVRPDARVVNASNPQWHSRMTVPFEGDLYAGLYALERGTVRLVFDSGAVSTIEAPARFRIIDGKEMSLNNGAVYVEVIGPDPEFAVVTPSGIIRDLGTAFGVSVDSNGSTETVVMDGRVQVELPNVPPEQSIVLDEAKLCRISGETRQVEELRPVTGEHEYLRYPRTVNYRVWLANLICEPESGILADCMCAVDMTSGARLNQQRKARPWRSKPDQYSQAPWNDVIDGVFVPKSASGTVIDSAGTTFDGFTSFGESTFGDLLVGLGTSQSTMDWYETLGISRQAITMHSSKGITLDLEQLSAAHDGLAVQRFTGMLLNRGSGNFDRRNVDFDFWILADGQVLSAIRQLTPADGFQKINVDIPVGTRFLTLAITAGENRSQAEDWGVLDHAALELAGEQAPPLQQ